MTNIFDIPVQALLGQLLIGLINGSFYAILSLGLAIIFGLLNIINFTHGAQYMLGAVIAWMSLTYLGINYWVGLIFAPLVVGGFGILMERYMLRRLYHLDHLYGLLLTFAHFRPGLDPGGWVSADIRYIRTFLPHSEGLSGGGQSWLHVSSLLSCLGGCCIVDRVFVDLVRDRTNKTGLLSACRY